MVISTRQQSEFCRNAKTFLERVLRHRRALIGSNKNNINLTRAEQTIDYINRHMKAGVLFKKNRGTANFLLLNQSKIRYLIDDQNNGLIEQFDAIVGSAKLYKYL